MKKIKIIYNPTAGTQSNKRSIDAMCNDLLDKGYTLQKFFTTGKESAYSEVIKSNKDEFDIIIACGGDGTVNEVINALADVKSKMKLGIVPMGTVNDFATYLGLSSSGETLVELIDNDLSTFVDIGIAGRKYFINVAAGGKLANVGHETEKSYKAIFGKLAYLAEGIKVIPDFINSDFHIKYMVDGEQYEDDIYLFLVANSSSIGGFKKIAPKASISDGYFDLVLIKNQNSIVNLAQLFLQIIAGGHVENEDIKYFHAKEIIIESDTSINVDIDGEYAGKLPMTIKVANYKVNVFTNIKE